MFLIQNLWKTYQNDKHFKYYQETSFACMFNQLSLAASFHKCLGNLNNYGSEPILLTILVPFKLIEKSFLLSKCIKMSCHHECALHLLYSCYLFVPFRCCCEPVDQGVGVQPWYFDDPYFLSHKQGKRKPPSLSISLILCFPTSILSTIILHTIPCPFVSY